MKPIDLKNAYKLSSYKLTKDEKELFSSLPSDYREFLKKTNGGMTVDSSKCFFKTDLVRTFEDDRIYEGSSNGIEELFGFLSYENEEPGKEFEVPMSILHQYYDRHLEEEFLPSNVIVIGRCIQNSLLAISLNEDDYGSVYYWEWYWQYPWFEEYFKERISTVSAKYENLRDILGDPNDPQFRKAYDALNYATLVKVASSFTTFMESLYEASDDEASDQE